MRFSTLLSTTALFELGLAAYTLEDDYMSDFYGSFNFFTGADPTEGFVKFVDQATATSTNLISSGNATAKWGVDTTNKTPGGRPAIRLESKKTYSSGLIVLDVAHMPFGCGTWPAFWTVGPNWPNNGEIDIIEGVHEQATDAMTLHTGPGCTIGQDVSAFAGKVSTTNCDVKAAGQAENTGCGIKSADTKSYGAGLNSNKGGVYATEWTAEGISIYFFPRGAIPADVLGDNPDPSGWGKPAAKFDGGCNIPSIFKDHQIVFDTTFCGSWAGAVWADSTCASKAATCNDYVQNNPEAFTEAYWEINALKVYQSNGQAANPTKSASPSTKYSASQSIAQSATAVPVSSGNSKPSSKSAAAPAPVSGKHSHAAPSAVAPSAPPAKGAQPVDPTSATAPSAPAASAPAASAPAASAPAASAPAASVPAASVPAVSPPAPSAGAPAGGHMSGFNWPKGGAGHSHNGTNAKTAVAAQPYKAVAPAAASGTVVSDAPAAKPTHDNGSPAAVIEVTHVVTKTVEKTVYVTDDMAVATAPANAKMARFIKDHKRGLTRHHQRR